MIHILRVFLVLLLCLSSSISLSACSDEKVSQDKSGEEQNSEIKKTETQPVINTEGAKITKFHYRYDGSIAGLNYAYTLQKKSDNYLFTYENPLNPRLDGRQKEVDNEIIDKLHRLYDKYEIAEWNGFDKTGNMVVDGDSFSLEILFDNEEKLRAGGANASPKGYYDFRKDLDEVFKPIVDEFRELEKKEAIEKGVKGELEYVIINFYEKADTKPYSYRFALNRAFETNYNFSIEIISKGGEFFEEGEYRYYANLPEEAINFKGIQDLFEKYGLIKWYGYDGLSDEPKEAFDMYFSFEEGSVSAMGTGEPENYQAFRKEFLELMAQNIKDAIEKYGLKKY